MSSLLFLGFSVIVFFITYGIAFTLVPIILGAFFSLDLNDYITDPDWLTINNNSQTTVEYIVPLMPTIGLFLAVMKIFMVATAKGRD